MQALKDAAIVLVALTLLISFRVTRIDPTESLETGSLMTQTEAAESVPTDAPVPAPTSAAEIFDPTDALPTTRDIATVLDQDTAVRWVVAPAGDAKDTAIEFNVAERCSEILFLIREAVGANGRKALTREVERVVKAAPCPRA